ncbi:MAG: STAS domain-containing protein [bacterium]|jgi:anti-sigma B factor antagonist
MFKYEKNSVIVVHFIEDEQLQDPEPLRKFLREILAEGNTKLLIDLGNVTYISSSVLGILITTYQELKQINGDLKLLNIQPGVSNLFKITRLDRIIEIYHDENAAIKSFG